MFQLSYQSSSKKTILILLLLSLFAKADAQDKFQKLESKLLKTDSVFLVSHLWSPNIEPVVDEKAEKKIVYGLLKNQKLNQESLVEKRILDDNGTLQLSKILCRTFNDSAIEMAKCFMPHHAIIIYTNGKILFIDICFNCHRINASKELQISESDFDYRKWRDLLLFFKQQGMKYELNQRLEYEK